MGASLFLSLQKSSLLPLPPEAAGRSPKASILLIIRQMRSFCNLFPFSSEWPALLFRLIFQDSMLYWM